MRKVDCYPTLSWFTIDQLDHFARQAGHTRTRYTAEVAHLSLWNHACLEVLQPYTILPVTLHWKTPGEIFGLFPSESPKKIHIPDGRRIKFRISFEDMQRLKVLQYSVFSSSRDSLWSLLIPSVLQNDRVIRLIHGNHI